ncbi:hypothetical protein [Levilactobacillus brevis]|nr:hypothetical protein [Levilactobacillus brevis]AJA81044.1 hypothetical protein L747_08290 [Levilactobacillus brevis BSO 464]
MRKDKIKTASQKANSSIPTTAIYFEPKVNAILETECHFMSLYEKLKK